MMDRVDHNTMVAVATVGDGVTVTVPGEGGNVAGSLTSSSSSSDAAAAATPLAGGPSPSPPLVSSPPPGADAGFGLCGSCPSRLHCSPPLGLLGAARRLPQLSPSPHALLGYSPPAAAVVKIEPSNPVFATGIRFGGFVMGGSSIGEGTLSLSDFVASAKALIEKWKEEGYLALEGVYRNPGGRHAQSSKMHHVSWKPGNN
uniref:Uncharacterized protein n=1 Tax=Oryza nivara TaxID=4536 RepID=A0A0E0JAV2_ORYNI